MTVNHRCALDHTHKSWKEKYRVLTFLVHTEIPIFIPQSLLPPLLGACAPAQNIFVGARVGEVVRGEGDAVTAMLQEDLLDRAPRTRAAAATFGREHPPPAVVARHGERGSEARAA